MGAHDAGDAHEQALLARDLLRQAHQARQGARDLDDGHLVGAAEGIDTLEAHDEVQRLVGHLGKWMGWVQAHRHEQGLDFTQKVFAHPFALGAAALAMGDHAYALPRKGRSVEHTSELQSPCNLVCRLLLEKKKKKARAGTSLHMTMHPLLTT